MTAPCAGGVSAAGSWEKGSVVATPSTACMAVSVLSVACEAATGVGAGGTGAVVGMEMDNGSVTATASVDRRVMAVACTACRIGALGAGKIGVAEGRVTDPVAAVAYSAWLGCGTATGTTAGTGVGRAGAAGGRTKGPVAATVSAAYRAVATAAGPVWPAGRLRTRAQTEPVRPTRL